MSDAPFDVCVIGAGVVGCAIARALSHHHLAVVLVEAGDDVGAGTSKANTAILHTGFDAKPGTLEARLVRRGHTLLSAYAAATGIPLDPIGALLVAWTAAQRDTLPRLAQVAAENGYTRTRLLSSSELSAAEPHLAAGALAALAVPDEAIICPFTTPLAFATDAVLNGVTLRLGTTVRGVAGAADGVHHLTTDGAPIAARWVVNAAGLQADTLDRVFGHSRFTIAPRRGELLVYDKLARPLVRHILLPVPTATTKGVLVTPTVFGNVLLGPTAENVTDRRDTASTAAGIAALIDRGRRIVPALVQEDVTAVYVGLRTATEHADYQIHCEPTQRYVCVGGIRSTGLSASMAIAEHVLEQLCAAGLALAPKADVRTPRMPNLGEHAPRPYQDADRIAVNPDYGRIVCHCERVTRGEILDATAASVPATTLDGVRRRTRALLGRCQGFYCLAEVTEMLAGAGGRSCAELLGGERR